MKARINKSVFYCQVIKTKQISTLTLKRQAQFLHNYININHITHPKNIYKKERERAAIVVGLSSIQKILKGRPRVYKMHRWVI